MLPADARKEYQAALRHLKNLKATRREQEGVLETARRRKAPLKRLRRIAQAAAQEKRAASMLKATSRLGRQLLFAEQACQQKRRLYEDPPLHTKLVVIPVKEVQLRAAKYDVVLREAGLWATLAMHTILTRMVMFRCKCCNERFPTFHPAYRPPEELGLELLKKRQGDAPACSVEVASWDDVPPLKEKEEDLLVAPTYEGRCLVCQLDIRRWMKKEGVQDEDLAVALRSMRNHMDPCWNFPAQELGELFARATVTEAMLIALEHMQVYYVQIGRTGLDKFRKNAISFVQDVASTVERLGLLRHYRVGDRVNSRRGPGADPQREPKLARLAGEEDLRRFAVDRDGYLVFPATVKRVEGVRFAWVEYDDFKGEEYLEAVENVEARQHMPWNPKQLRGKLVIMLRRNVRHGDAIEGLEVRWEVVSQILQALTALPELYPFMKLPDGTVLPWREGGGVDEPMHKYYDRKHGMFDLLSEGEMRERLAPQTWQGELLEDEEVLEMKKQRFRLQGVDVRTPQHMLATGLEVRIGQGAGGAEGGEVGAGSGGEVVDEEVFGKWLELSGMPLGRELSAWWRDLPAMDEGDVQGWKASGDEVASDLFARIRADMQERDWLEAGAVTVRGLARWCRASVSKIFGGEDMTSVEEVADFMWMELRVVVEQFFDTHSGGAMDEGPERPDVDVEARDAAQKVVYGYPGQAREPTKFEAEGRFAKSHPLEFPMGIGDLFDPSRPRPVSARVWVQHLLRLWGGTCVHGLRGHRLVWAMVNALLLTETRGKGHVVQKNAVRRMGVRLGSEEPLTRAQLQELVRDEGAASKLVHTLMVVGQDVRSTPMFWAQESKKLDCAVKHIACAPVWVKVAGTGGPEDVPRSCYLGDNELVEDRVGHGRSPAMWWTKNCRYTCAYDIHRLNVADAFGFEAVSRNDALARRARFKFVRDSPDIVSYMLSLRAELLMRIVMPTVLPHSLEMPFLVMARAESGPGGNPHVHGLAYGAGNPAMKGLECEEVAVEGSSDEGDREDEGKKVEEGSGESAEKRPGKRGRPKKRGRKATEAAKPVGEASAVKKSQQELLSEKEREFWAYFGDKVSEWNPCHGEDGSERFRWDEEVGAHDVEVCLDDYCADVSTTPHTTRLSHLLERVLRSDCGEAVAEVDLNPIRQLVAALVNQGGRHDRHGMRAPKKKDACARGKPECPYCRYGFPHKLVERCGCKPMLLERGDREGQWTARFPRNDRLCCGYEPHVLLANLGNVDWRPMLNLWAVVEYVTKYATKAPEGSKPLREVLRESVNEVCKYTREGEPLDLMRQGLQKFYSRTLGGRDYGMFEAVHVGLGLPSVFPLMPVVTLHTGGVRVLKTEEQLAKTGRGGSVVWDSKVDKFDKRLEMLRRKPGRRTDEERRLEEARIRDVSLWEFYWKYIFSGSVLRRSATEVALQVLPNFSADCAHIGHAMHEALARKSVVAYWRNMATLDRFRLIERGPAVDRRKWGGTSFVQPFAHGERRRLCWTGISAFRTCTRRSRGHSGRNLCGGVQLGKWSRVHGRWSAVGRSRCWRCWWTRC